MEMTTSARELLRNAPGALGDFKAADSTRTPVEIVAHLGDLFDWALSIAKGKQVWHDSEPLEWPDEVQRFFETLKAFDDYLASSGRLHAPPDRLLQGPIADAMQHVGQLAMLRRLAGNP